MKTHVAAALHSGDITKEEMDEIVLHFSAYYGFAKGEAFQEAADAGQATMRTSTWMSGAAGPTTPPSASRRWCRIRPRQFETDDGHRGDAGAAHELEPRAWQRMTLRARRNNQRRRVGPSPNARTKWLICRLPSR